MNKESLNQEKDIVSQPSRSESSKLAEQMPEDPGAMNICYSCE